jgi:hypothetical protein
MTIGKGVGFFVGRSVELHLYLPMPVILGLVPRTPASAEKKEDAESGEIAANSKRQRGGPRGPRSKAEDDGFGRL